MSEETCECINELQARIKEQCLSDQDLGNMRPKNATIDSVLCDNVAFMMPNLRKKLSIPFSADWKLANGKRKETKIRVTASHCPFCGKEIK